MNGDTVVLEIADDGTITIPGDVVHRLHLGPRQKVALEERDDALVLKPTPGGNLERIGNLLESALPGVQWVDIEGGREDRCV